MHGREWHDIGVTHIGSIDIDGGKPHVVCIFERMTDFQHMLLLDFVVAFNPHFLGDDTVDHYGNHRKERCKGNQTKTVNQRITSFNVGSKTQTKCRDQRHGNG